MKTNKKLLWGLLLLAMAIPSIFLSQNAQAKHKANYLTFTAEKNNSSVSFYCDEYSRIQYRTNKGKKWNKCEDYGRATIELKKKGDAVQLRGYKNTGLQFSMTGKIAASGSVTSLTDGNGGNPNVKLTECCYKYMFSDCTSLTTAPELPATQLAEHCYENMFSNCTSLTTAPELPATQLASYCYCSMFEGCDSLTSAPELPATQLASSCYYNMFEGCDSLTSAPEELPATQLADSCYDSMFQGCTRLTAAPDLPATRLASSCYRWMFLGCNSLEHDPTEDIDYCDIPYR